MTLWWALLALGVVSSTATAVGTIRAHGDERVPRQGFRVSASRRRPRWAWLPTAVGVFLMSFASGRLAPGGDWSYLALFGGAVVLSSALQLGLVAAHNRRFADEVTADDGGRRAQPG